MDIGTAFKLSAFMLWSFLLVFLYYLFDRKGFKETAGEVQAGWL